MSSELLRFVHDELEYFQLEWKHDMSDASIRRGSASLRTLLHENKLQLAWKYCGFEKQPKFLASTLSDLDLNLPENDFVFRQAGGAKSFGISVGDVQLFDRSLSAEEIKAMYDAGPKDGPRLVPLSLVEFAGSTSIIISKTKISRIEIILYVCNKLGGAHLDETRKPDKTLEGKFVLLDGYRKNLKLADRDPVYFELLSTVHFLQQSKDMHKLRKAIDHVLG